MHPSIFFNMVETAVYYESKAKTTVHEQGARIVTIRCSGSINLQMTACISAASNGEKLLLFLFLKVNQEE